MKVDDHAARLARLDCCAVSDALDQLGLPASVVGLSAVAQKRRIAGRVATVALRAGKAPADAHVTHLGAQAIQSAEPGQVIVVEQAAGVVCASWGGILSNAARVKGVAGVIVEGLARDVDEADEIGFTVYARGVTARTARGRVHEHATGVAVRVGDVSVDNGDWVIADGSGVAFIPAGQIARVLDAAERIARREGVMTKAVLGGQPVTQVMGASYEQLLDNKELGE